MYGESRNPARRREVCQVGRIEMAEDVMEIRRRGNRR
jgi:hypothetical protein